MRPRAVTPLALCLAILLSLALLAFRTAGGRAARPSPGSAAAPELLHAPRTWDEAALADWSLPIAALDVRPGHFSAAEYYAAPVDNLRTYPVYHPDFEPAGYWEQLQRADPQPLVAELGRARTRQEWIALGRRVFEEQDIRGFRRGEPEILAEAHSRAGLARANAKVLADGTIFGLRWVPTAAGLKLSIDDCGHCHTRVTEDGHRIPGAPLNLSFDNIARWHIVLDGLSYFMPGETILQQFSRIYGVPWLPDDPGRQFLFMSMEDLYELNRSLPGGVIARANSSPFYPTKVPDLIGFADQLYINHTATHVHRDAGDFMRYAAMVAYEDPMDFGKYQFYSPAQRVMRYRHPDDALFALAMYVYSLEPPPNPHPRDARAQAGERVFRRLGCGMCHTPPLYTNNKLTPAEGFTPPREHYRLLRIHNAPVRTDPGLALRTRKGTGYYKVPSLRGVWYRNLYLHDGSLASLEELFDPRRLEADFVPSGFKGYRVERRAIGGHAYGLELDAEERAQLVAFLRTL